MEPLFTFVLMPAICACWFSDYRLFQIFLKFYQVFNAAFFIKVAYCFILIFSVVLKNLFCIRKGV